MASVSTTLETIPTADSVSQVMNLLVENFTEPQKKKLSQWLKLIEEHAERVIQNLTQIKLKRRKIEIVAAAAIYDGFLEYESRTGVKLGFPHIHEVLGQSQCIFNTTWKKLFDNRGTLRGDQLDVVYVGKDWSLEEAVLAVIKEITKAVDELTPKMNKWLDSIRDEAIELIQIIPQDTVKSYDMLTGAVTIIYAAIQHHHGKMQVRIAQRDLSILSATSPALISKCWIDLFGNRE